VIRRGDIFRIGNFFLAAQGKKEINVRFLEDNQGNENGMSFAN